MYVSGILIQFLFFPFGYLRQGFSVVVLAVLKFPVDQAGLKLQDPPASASQVLGLEVCTTSGLNPVILTMGNSYHVWKTFRVHT